MNGKKRILSWIMAGCLFLMMTGCTQTGTGTVPSGESTQPESSVISQTSEEESSRSQEESNGTQSETGGESSEEKSRQETGKHETMLPDISSDDPGFSIVFSQNPLDAGYAAEAEDAATTREMLEISRKYRDLWKEEVAGIHEFYKKFGDKIPAVLLEELDATFKAVDLNTTRCLVLTGAGEKSFVAGADIGEMSTLTKAEGEAFGKKGNDVFRMIETFPIPVIAAVNGFALGGGCEISMSCDIRICSENAVFGQPEAGLGITPGFGGTQRLARVIPVGMAKQMIYTARNIKAEEAYRVGLVNAVYPLEELMPAAKKMAAGIAMQAPIAVRNCKKAINEGLQVDMDQAIVIEEKLFGDCFETEDQKAGMGNFLEKDKEKKLKVVPFQNK